MNNDYNADTSDDEQNYPVYDVIDADEIVNAINLFFNDELPLVAGDLNEMVAENVFHYAFFIVMWYALACLFNILMVQYRTVPDISELWDDLAHCGDGEKWEKMPYFDYTSSVVPLWLVFLCATLILICSPVFIMFMIYLPYIPIILIRRICYIPFESV